MKPQLNFVIGLRVRQAREAAGLTQEKLAELVDRTKEAISNIERGVNYPTIETLQRIADALDVSLSYLLQESQGSRAYDGLTAKIYNKTKGMSEKDLEFIIAFIDRLKAYKDESQSNQQH